MKKGIDVSKHQGKIDWKKVKSSGVDFAIIRAGFGKSTVDEYFVQNITGAIANGIEVGVYWFIYALNDEDIIKNANKFIQTIAQYKNYITMKCWCDFEYDTENYASKKSIVFTKSSRTAMIDAFCKEIEKNGYEAGIYLNPDYIKNKVNKLNYPLWLAQYASQKSYDCMIWQHSSKGYVPGINGNVDLDIAYTTDSMYYPKYTGTTTSIVAALQSLNIDSNFNYRRKIAAVNNIKGYIGTAAQNTYMLNLLKQGVLKKV